MTDDEMIAEATEYLRSTYDEPSVRAHEDLTRAAMRLWFAAKAGAIRPNDSLKAMACADAIKRAASGREAVVNALGVVENFLALLTIEAKDRR